MNKIYVILFFIIVYVLAFCGCSSKKNVTIQREKEELIQSASSRTISGIELDVDHDVTTYRETLITYGSDSTPRTKVIREKIVDKTKDNTKQQSIITTDTSVESVIERTDKTVAKKTSFSIWGMLTLVWAIFILLYLFRGVLKTIPPISFFLNRKV